MRHSSPVRRETFTFCGLLFPSPLSDFSSRSMPKTPLRLRPARGGNKPLLAVTTSLARAQSCCQGNSGAISYRQEKILQFPPPISCRQAFHFWNRRSGDKMSEAPRGNGGADVGAERQCTDIALPGRVAVDAARALSVYTVICSRAAGEPERAKSLCRIADSTLPTPRNRRTPNSNAPAASAGPAQVKQNNSSPSAFRRAYSRKSAVARPGGRCSVKHSFTKCWERPQRGQLNLTGIRSRTRGCGRTLGGQDQLGSPMRRSSWRKRGRPESGWKRGSAARKTSSGSRCS